MPRPIVKLSGEADLSALAKIARSRPRGRDIVDHARKIKGVKLVAGDDGKFEATATTLKAKRELAAVFETTRKLEGERGDELQSRRELIPVINRRGRRVKINADSEAGAAKAGLLQAARRVFGRMDLPRCSDGRHDYRDGRCWWCGREASP